MEWLNLHTSILDSPAVVGSDPIERGTWLMLLRFCIGQENSGKIADCRAWKNRKWQQLVRVTQKEVLTRSDLWSWEGNDLIVTHYPLDKQLEIQQMRDLGKRTSEAKRTAAKANGTLGGRPAKNPTENPTTEPTETHAKPIEGKGKEIGREGEEEEEAATAAAAITPEMLVATYPRRSHLADALRAAKDCMRRHEPQKILDGTRAIAAVVARWTESERLNYLKKPSEFFAGDHWADDPELWRGRHDRNTAPPATDLPSLGGRQPSLKLTL
jgi:hypothetical protein